MSFELTAIRPYLASPAVVIADDIQNNEAFSEWISKAKLGQSFMAMEQAKDSIFGIGLVGFSGN